VFEILTRKCEYGEDVEDLGARVLECRTQGVAMIERSLRNAIRKSQLPRHLDARRAAIGLHAYVDGLLYDWLMAPGSFDLAAEAGPMIDLYLTALKSAPEVKRSAGARDSTLAGAARRPARATGA
jgi:TetR/AcrR family acrAB operon transcriptional repressor